MPWRKLAVTLEGANQIFSATGFTITKNEELGIYTAERSVPCSLSSELAETQSITKKTLLQLCQAIVEKLTSDRLEAVSR